MFSGTIEYVQSRLNRVKPLIDILRQAQNECLKLFGSKRRGCLEGIREIYHDDLCLMN